MSIFISIASYQDPLLVSTIFSAYNNARNKDELVFSICDQSDDGIKVEEIGFVDQIHYEHVNPLFSKGPCWARHRAQNFFNDEDLPNDLSNSRCLALYTDVIEEKGLFKTKTSRQICKSI